MQSMMHWLMGDGSERSLGRSLRGLLVVVLTLGAMGLIMSASFGRPGYEMDRVRKHGICLAFGLGLFLLTCRLPLTWLRRHVYHAYGLVIALLIAVLFFPDKNNAHRWILIGGFSLQPSEFAKPVVILLVAHLAADRERLRATFREGFARPLLWLGILCGFILIEPDFGTSLFLGTVGMVILLAAGARSSHFLAVVLFFLPIVVMYGLANFEHVERRFRMMFETDVYQLNQGQLALVSGGLLGVGVGRGVMKLGLVPEGHNDFVFSLIGEEWGLAGALGVLLLFFAFVIFGLRIVVAIRDRFRRFVVFGGLFLVSLQAFFNLAVVLRMAPPKGIALPFISSGGSSVSALLLVLGLVVNAATSPERNEHRTWYPHPSGE